MAAEIPPLAALHGADSLGGETLRAAGAVVDALLPTGPLAHPFTQMETALPPESLPSAVDTLLQIPSTHHAALHAASAAEFFGPASVAAPAGCGGGDLPAATDLPLLQCLVLLIAAFYAQFLYDHMADIRTLFSRRTHGDRLRENRGGRTRFYVTALVIGGVLASAFAFRLPGARTFVDAAPHAGSFILFASAAAAVGAIVLYQYGLLQAVGRLTLSQEVTDGLLRLKTLALTGLVVAATPPALLLALAPEGSSQVWIVILAAACILALAAYLRETLPLFISKKISVLHWFLYLCIVELFPVSLLWLILSRSHAS